MNSSLKNQKPSKKPLDFSAGYYGSCFFLTTVTQIHSFPKKFLRKRIKRPPLIERWRIFPCRELRRTSPTRRAQIIVQAASLFNQLLQHFPRTEFAALVKKHGAERATKGFACWTQFVAMLFCQLARADSLRDICNG